MSIFEIQGMERVIVILGAFIFGILGYLLYSKGLNSDGTILYDGKWGKLKITGVGPGLFFMLFSAFILVVSLYTKSTIEYTDETITKNENGEIVNKHIIKTKVYKVDKTAPPQKSKKINSISLPEEKVCIFPNYIENYIEIAKKDFK